MSETPKPKEKVIRCGQCGHKGMERKNVKGQTFPYKQYDVELAVDLELYTCPKCDNMALTPGDCKALDEAIRKTLESAK